MSRVLESQEPLPARVENYVRYRPGYPAGVVALLREGCGLVPAWVVADVGAGPGNLTRLFLENGNTVVAVEPSRQMRIAGKRLMRDYPGFRSTAGSAENTSLLDGSVDLVVAGQAFHHFDPIRCKREWRRILHAPHWVALVWNVFRVESSPVLAGYEVILQHYALDPAAATLQVVVPNDVLTAFFAPHGYNQASFPNAQSFDFDGLTGRLLSVASIPEPGHRSYTAMIEELRGLFETHQRMGAVSFDYDTTVYYGRI
jgi:SAM-dependent methyltransferase